MSMPPGSFLSSEEAVDLSTCAREPIHIPGAVQPHGVLFVLREPGLEVLQVSENVEAVFGEATDSWLGRPLSEQIDPSFLERLHAWRSADTLGAASIFTAPIRTASALRVYEVALHRTEAGLVVEIVAPPDHDDAEPEMQPLLQHAVDRLQGARSTKELCAVAAEEVRRITGFDRVKVYRFDEEWNGSVVAEARAEGVDSYLGLHFPAADIPAQARALYLRNRSRLIPDVDYVPARIVPELNPDTSEPIDLSQSVLRSVSPVHIEYLRNMGVRASMSVSIIREGRLWGLIACHHRTPLPLSYRATSTCTLLGQVLALMLASREELEEQEHVTRMRGLHANLLEAMFRVDDFAEGLAQSSQQVLDLMEASGAAIYNQGSLVSLGETPGEAELRTLVAWLPTQIQDGLYATDALPRVYPEAEHFREIASGVLAVSLSRLREHYLIWFRPELPRTVYWAGSPDKAVRVEDDGARRLHPRTSFAAWKSVMRGRSRPWRVGEIESARMLVASIMDAVFERAAQLSYLNASLQQANHLLTLRNRELQDFANAASHDLQEPLRKVQTFADLIQRDHGEALHEEASFYLDRIADSARRMSQLLADLLNFSLVTTEGGAFRRVDLREIAEEVALDFRQLLKAAGARLEIAPLPIVEADAGQMRQLLTQLLDNAVKFRHPERPLAVIIRAGAAGADGEEGFCTLIVEDNGIGFDEKYALRIFKPFQRLHAQGAYPGSGMGLAICRRIAERHGGTIQARSTPGVGSRFEIRLPIAQVHLQEPAR